MQHIHPFHGSTTVSVYIVGTALVPVVVAVIPVVAKDPISVAVIVPGGPDPHAWRINPIVGGRGIVTGRRIGVGVRSVWRHRNPQIQPEEEIRPRECRIGRNEDEARESEGCDCSNHKQSFHHLHVTHLLSYYIYVSPPVW